MREYVENRVLISGAAGFIGSHLCGLLLEKGYEVVAIDNFVTGSAKNIEPYLKHSQFQFIKLDLTHPLPHLPPVNFIFHLASPASPVNFDNLSIEIMLVNSLGTYNLLELARTNKARFILGSTSEVYGDPKQHPQKEEYWGNVNTTGPRSCYDESKRFAEALCMSFKRRHDLSIGIARIFNTYGPRMRSDDGRVISNFVCQALKGEPITIYGDGKQIRSFCYVSDLIEGLFLLMNADCSGPVNLGNPDEHTILDIAELVKILTGSLSLFSFSPLPTDDPRRRKPDISKAKALLGWEPKVSIEVGVEHTIEWYIEEMAQFEPISQGYLNRELKGEG